MNDPLDKLAILIPTRNRPDILANTLAELQKAGLGNVALWVYDDCSVDGDAIKRAVKSWPGAQVLRGANRVGQAEGRNALMRACGREFGLLIDDDSFPTDVKVLEKHLGEARDPQRAITTFQYLDVPTQRLSTPQEYGAGVSRSFQGGGSLFHIPTVLGIGGFRSFFIYGYEEPELAMRIHLNDLHIWYDPALVVRHNHFETPNENRDYREYDYLYARNSILMSSMNLPFLIGLPHGMIRSVRRSLYQRRHFKSKLAGTLAGIKMTFSKAADRTPCSLSQAFEWFRFNRECKL
jgi:GT2 family glycosyltransferase